MSHGPYSTWDFYPQYLNRDEVNNPLIVIREFFSADWPAGHLKALKAWRSFVTEDRHYTDHQQNPASLLYTYLLHVQLIEASFLLVQSNQKRKQPVCVAADQESSLAVDQDNQLSNEQSSWLHFPQGLSRQELLDPYLILESFFKDYNLPQYRAFLYQWLEKGLSRFAADSDMPVREIIHVYENLEKLYGAAWLIRQREMPPVLKKTNADVKDVARQTAGPETAETIATETAVAKEKETITIEAKKEVTNPASNAILYPAYALNIAINRERQQLLARVISTVKHKVPTVEAVIYLGALTAKPDEMPSIYLLVIISNDESKQGHELSSTLEESCKPLATVTALVHSAGVFLKSVERKNYFFCGSLSKPVLYLSGNLSLPVLPETNKELFKQNREKNFQHGHGLANEFLNGANYYLSAGSYGLACFSLHQATENALVAISRAVLGYRANLHNLARLFRITGMFTEELKSVFSLDTIEGVQLFNLLQKAYNDSRYKEDFKPDEASVNLLFGLVSNLLGGVRAIYKQTFVE